MEKSESKSVFRRYMYTLHWSIIGCRPVVRLIAVSIVTECRGTCTTYESLLSLQMYIFPKAACSSDNMYMYLEVTWMLDVVSYPCFVYFWSNKWKYLYKKTVTARVAKYNKNISNNIEICLNSIR